MLEKALEGSPEGRQRGGVLFQASCLRGPLCCLLSWGLFLSPVSTSPLLALTTAVSILCGWDLSGPGLRE